MSKGIYCIVAPSGSAYIGLTLSSFEQRWKGHKKLLAKGNHHCKGLQRAYQKYGEKMLAYSILEEVDENYSEADALALEQFHWDKWHKAGINLYNGRPSGKGSVFHKPETKAAISLAIRNRNPQATSKVRKICLNCRKIHGSKTSELCPMCVAASFEEEFKDRIIALYEDGCSIREINRLLGISHTKLRKLMKKWDITIKPRTFNGKVHSEEFKDAQRVLGELRAAFRSPLKCSSCGNDFDAKPSSKRKFCSRSCYLKKNN